MEKKDEKIGAALRKVALGYQIAEVTEEYAEVDGELKLTKRKKTKKDVPPDLKAVQLLLSSEGGGDITALSDEELERERQRLLGVLCEAEKETKTAATKKAATKKAATEKATEATRATKSTGAATEKTVKTVKTVKKRAKPRKRVVRKAKA